jgi:SAM-dependent methyltransferase
MPLPAQHVLQRFRGPLFWSGEAQGSDSAHLINLLRNDGASWTYRDGLGAWGMVTLGYYADKLATLQDLFGTQDVALEDSNVRVGDRVFPIVDDVIILLSPQHYPPALRYRLGESQTQAEEARNPFAPEIQYSFGQEWQAYPEILPEHRAEFEQYFDLIDTNSLTQSRVCDLGCGIGRWSSFLAGSCREIILVDFSEAIFVARKNLASHSNALFFMGDITSLPFQDDAMDLAFCLGVLHHLPVDCLQAVRSLRRLSPKLLIYLYYALDNRPWHFRALFQVADAVRLAASRIQSPVARKHLTHMLAIVTYYPFILLGDLLSPLGLGRYVPLWEAYHGKGFQRICQDVYDRFFTSIEQRVSRAQIETLKDTFGKISVSEGLPYWHFLCER